ncbi:hypothetical protein HDU76_008936, partial [Blyttiomyces sp. JEL0837]
SARAASPRLQSTNFEVSATASSPIQSLAGTSSQSPQADVDSSPTSDMTNLPVNDGASSPLLQSSAVAAPLGIPQRRRQSTLQDSYLDAYLSENLRTGGSLQSNSTLMPPNRSPSAGGSGHGQAESDAEHQRFLHGTRITTFQRLEGLDGRYRAYAVFPDLCILSPGIWQLEFVTVQVLGREQIVLVSNDEVIRSDDERGVDPLGNEIVSSGAEESDNSASEGGTRVGSVRRSGGGGSGSGTAGGNDQGASGIRHSSSVGVGVGGVDASWNHRGHRNSDESSGSSDSQSHTPLAGTGTSTPQQGG